MMCCHPVPHSCMEKIYMSTCRNLLLLPPLCHCSASSIYWLSYQSVRTGINISIARKWHIRMRRRFGKVNARARAESLPASHNIWKRREKKKKTTKSRQALRIQSGPSVVHKNHFLPKALLRKKQALLIPTWSPTVHVVLTEPEDAYLGNFAERTGCGAVILVWSFLTMQLLSNYINALIIIFLRRAGLTSFIFHPSNQNCELIL